MVRKIRRRWDKQLVTAGGLLVMVAGCGNDADWLSRGKIPALHAAVKPSPPPTILASPLAPTTLSWQSIPVPPADGPSLLPLELSVPVRDAPERGGKPVGSLRVGAKVARSQAPVSRKDCLAGWYAVRPLGFVCADSDATVDEQHPIARALSVEPDRSRPMPYAYGFIRAVAPNYLRVPNRDEQFTYEMRLERHLRSFHKLKTEWDRLDVGANDVPLDAAGLAVGPLPNAPRPLGESERFGGRGDDQVPWWLVEGRRIPNLSSFKTPSFAVIANRIKRHAGVAMIGSFVAPETSQNRRFAITTDARLIPADKIRPSSGSPFHGVLLESIGLPVAFAKSETARSYELGEPRSVRGEALGRREMVPLTGRVRMVGKERYVEARSGKWYLSRELATIAKPTTLPAIATGKTRWIDVSIVNQTLVLWEGNRPIYATLVSTGRDGLGDPATTFSTPEGSFPIFQKHVTATMDSTAADTEFELRDVPWVMYFKGGYALHAAYWHDDFGRPRSHGCINLSPIDARYVFNWSTPEVPEHWHSVNAGDAFEEGTTVIVRP